MVVFGIAEHTKMGNESTVQHAASMWFILHCIFATATDDRTYCVDASIVIAQSQAATVQPEYENSAASIESVCVCVRSAHRIL